MLTVDNECPKNSTRRNFEVNVPGRPNKATRIKPLLFRVPPDVWKAHKSNCVVATPKQRSERDRNYARTLCQSMLKSSEISPRWASLRKLRAIGLWLSDYLHSSTAAQDSLWLSSLLRRWWLSWTLGRSRPWPTVRCSLWPECHEAWYHVWLGTQHHHCAAAAFDPNVQA